MTDKERKQAIETLKHMKLDLEQILGLPEGERRDAGLRKARETIFKFHEEMLKAFGK
jgi:hypothetical protein